MELFFGKKQKSEAEIYMEQRRAKESINNKNYGITNTTRSIDGAIMMVNDVFNIMGRGVVVVGTLQMPIEINQRVIINGMNAQIIGIESYRKQKQLANAGENVGILLRGINPSNISKGTPIYFS